MEYLTPEEEIQFLKINVMNLKFLKKPSKKAQIYCVSQLKYSFPRDQLSKITDPEAIDLILPYWNSDLLDYNVPLTPEQFMKFFSNNCYSIRLHNMATFEQKMRLFLRKPSLLLSFNENQIDPRIIETVIIENPQMLIHFRKYEGKVLAKNKEAIIYCSQKTIEEIITDENELVEALLKNNILGDFILSRDAQLTLIKSNKSLKNIDKNHTHIDGLLYLSKVALLKVRDIPRKYQTPEYHKKFLEEAYDIRIFRQFNDPTKEICDLFYQKLNLIIEKNPDILTHKRIIEYIRIIEINHLIFSKEQKRNFITRVLEKNVNFLKNFNSRSLDAFNILPKEQIDYFIKGGPECYQKNIWKAVKSYKSKDLLFYVLFNKKEYLKYNYWPIYLETSREERLPKHLRYFPKDWQETFKNDHKYSPEQLSEETFQLWEKYIDLIIILRLHKFLSIERKIEIMKTKKITWLFSHEEMLEMLKINPETVLLYIENDNKSGFKVDKTCISIYRLKPKLLPQLTKLNPNFPFYVFEDDIISFTKKIKITILALRKIHFHIPNELICEIFHENVKQAREKLNLTLNKH